MPLGGTYISRNRDERTQVRTDTQAFCLKSRRNQMKTIFAVIALSLFSVATFADPCMDANVSPLGFYDTTSSDELHLEEHGC
jgi:hypothetical protein